MAGDPFRAGRQALVDVALEGCGAGLAEDEAAEAVGCGVAVPASGAGADGAGARLAGKGDRAARGCLRGRLAVEHPLEPGEACVVAAGLVDAGEGVLGDSQLNYGRCHRPPGCRTGGCCRTAGSRLGRASGRFGVLGGLGRSRSSALSATLAYRAALRSVDGRRRAAAGAMARNGQGAESSIVMGAKKDLRRTWPSRTAPPGRSSSPRAAAAAGAAPATGWSPAR